MFRRSGTRSPHASSPALRSAVKLPEFAAAAAAAAGSAQSGKPADALPPYQLPANIAKHRVKTPTRLRDITNWYDLPQGPDDEADDRSSAPPKPATPLVKPSSVKGSQRLLEAVVRRNMNRRNAEEEAKAKAAETAGDPNAYCHYQDLQGNNGAHGFVPQSPSLTSPNVRHRIASARDMFKQAAAANRFTPALSRAFAEDEDYKPREHEAPRTPKRQRSLRLAAIAASASIAAASGSARPEPGGEFRFERLFRGAEDEDDGEYVVEDDETDDVAEEYEGMGLFPLYDYDCLPEHLQESPDILSGYRINYNTAQCFGSIFWLHNDSVSIWTLLASTLFFGYLFLQNMIHTGFDLQNMTYTDFDYLDTPFDWNFLVDPVDRYVIAGYCGIIAVSHLLSALYALFRPHKNTRVHDRFCLLDFNSFFIWVFAISCSIIHFSAYCDRELHYSLIFWTSLVTGIGILVPWSRVSYTKFFNRFQHNYHCAIVLPVMAMVTYSIYGMGYDMMLSAFAEFWHPLVGILAYILGRWCYENRFPEAFLEWNSDCFGTSQQIWHLVVFTCTYCVYRTLQQFAAARAATECSYG